MRDRAEGEEENNRNGYRSGFPGRAQNGGGRRTALAPFSNVQSSYLIYIFFIAPLRWRICFDAQRGSDGARFHIKFYNMQFRQIHCNKTNTGAKNRTRKSAAFLLTTLIKSNVLSVFNNPNTV